MAGLPQPQAGPGFNIQQFYAFIKAAGIQSANKFLCRIPLPPGLVGSPNETQWKGTSRVIEYWCLASSFPGVVLSTHNVSRYGYGPIEKKPFMPIFSDVTFQFIADGNGIIYDFFQQWINMMSNFDLRHGINSGSNPTAMSSRTRLDSYELSYKSDYAVDINIIVYNDNGSETLTIVLRDAYPTYLGDMHFNWAENSSFTKLPVSFTFIDWYNESIAGKPTY